MSLRLCNKFIQIDQQDFAKIQKTLEKHYYDFDLEYLKTVHGREDLINHLHRRLDNFRQQLIPWLNTYKPLDKARILEIGCGTGSSTVALAEQGGNVHAVDIEEKSLIVAKERCAVYNVDASFYQANATEIKSLFSNQRFDVIIFFAALEHMTLDERLASMGDAWSLLDDGALFCVVDTPNRLWFYDYHTSLLPFYQWLPDELAFKYARFSTRENFREIYLDRTEERFLHFLRRGRGISYHEFELALMPVDKLEVLSSMPIYFRKNSLFSKLCYWFSADSRYKSILAEFGPQNLHPGFLEPSLDLIIKKK